MTPVGRAKAAAFLRAIMHGSGERESRRFASAFREVCLPPPEGKCDWVVEFNAVHSWRNRDGLKHVFDDYPQLQQEFEEWLRLR